MRARAARALDLQEACVVVQGENQAMDLEEHLLGIGVDAQVAFGHRRVDGALQRLAARCRTIETRASRTGPGRSSNSTAPLM